MKTFLTRGEFAYHAKGAYIPSVDGYNVNLSTTYSASRDPDFHRNVLNLTLDGTELDALIVTLQNIRASKPASLPVEDYGWLKTDENAGAQIGEELKPVIVGFCRIALEDNRQVWSGYEEGRKTREKHRIAELDKTSCQAVIVVPEHVWTITSSYFRGLFGESIDTLGGPGFRNKYFFVARPELQTILMDHVSISYWKNPWHK
jgi:hypothetical protein